MAAAPSTPARVRRVGAPPPGAWFHDDGRRRVLLAGAAAHGALGGRAIRGSEAQAGGGATSELAEGCSHPLSGSARARAAPPTSNCPKRCALDGLQPGQTQGESHMGPRQNRQPARLFAACCDAPSALRTAHSACLLARHSNQVLAALLQQPAAGGWLRSGRCRGGYGADLAPEGAESTRDVRIDGRAPVIECNIWPLTPPSLLSHTVWPLARSVHTLRHSEVANALPVALGACSTLVAP